MSQNESQLLADYCRLKLDLQNTVSAEEYGYTSLPLCIIDTIFSINANYTATRNTVNRFVEYFKLTSPLSIRDFIALYQENSPEFMAEKIYQNRQRTSTRNGILKAEATLKVAQVLLHHDVNNFDDISAIINDPAFEVDFKGITGQGSGVSLRYFYMLIGLDSEIKPDRMIIRFIEAALGRSIKVEECHPLLTTACELLKVDYPNLTPRLLDNLIWLFQRQQ